MRNVSVGPGAERKLTEVRAPEATMDTLEFTEVRCGKSIEPSGPAFEIVTAPPIDVSAEKEMSTVVDVL